MTVVVVELKTKKGGRILNLQDLLKRRLLSGVRDSSEGFAQQLVGEGKELRWGRLWGEQN